MLSCMSRRRAPVDLLLGTNLLSRQGIYLVQQDKDMTVDLLDLAEVAEKRRETDKRDTQLLRNREATASHTTL